MAGAASPSSGFARSVDLFYSLKEEKSKLKKQIENLRDKLIKRKCELFPDADRDDRNLDSLRGRLQIIISQIKTLNTPVGGGICISYNAANELLELKKTMSDDIILSELTTRKSGLEREITDLNQRKLRANEILTHDDSYSQISQELQKTQTKLDEIKRKIILSRKELGQHHQTTFQEFIQPVDPDCN